MERQDNNATGLVFAQLQRIPPNFLGVQRRRAANMQFKQPATDERHLIDLQFRGHFQDLHSLALETSWEQCSKWTSTIKIKPISNKTFLQIKALQTIDGVERLLNMFVSAQLFLPVHVLHRLGLHSFRSSLLLFHARQVLPSVGLCGCFFYSLSANECRVACFCPRSFARHQFGTARLH